jgi:hypothetical protein
MNFGSEDEICGGRRRLIWFTGDWDTHTHAQTTVLIFCVWRGVGIGKPHQGDQLSSRSALGRCSGKHRSNEACFDGAFSGYLARDPVHA